MMIAEKLAYFFEATDLMSVFVDWPEEIGLVLCLDDAGTCEMLLHHRDEGRAVIRKAGAVLNCPVGQFAVVPEIEGYPTRRVMFSDEQKLLALVEDESDLAEMAADYLINYRFQKARKEKAVTAPSIAAAVPKPVEPFRWRPRLHFSEVRKAVQPKSKPVKGPEMPQGYAAAEAVKDSECRIAEGEISLGHRGVRLMLAADQVTIKTRTQLVQEIGFRDDFSRFVLPRKAVDGWQAGDPLVIDIPETRFPEGLRQRFAKGPRVAEVTVTAQGVFVAPGAAIPQPEVAEEAPIKKRRRFFTPGRAAMVALVGLGVATGTMMNAVELPKEFDALFQQVVAETDR
ncbi:hypothetical protein M4578_22335 [Salipiger sp. P9]|uniref:hypothetical protein n=1 Tax=Salipiger pentaromativorans TaxID=2943193 RepID=UPI00215739EF|nr:hypothetical protein [Salipiger pentaromativorans]MCR8550571.1 hypothetical protein [Salipiger pentaromativorans]